MTSNFIFNRVKSYTGEIEWYTPRQYLDSVIKVMGSIDLDPASSPIAQEQVKAIHYYTSKTNGLVQKWDGSVFLNPPYKMPLIRKFVLRMVEASKKKEIKQGILLTNNSTDTEWFHIALRGCSSLCLTRSRISFLQVNNGIPERKTNPTNGQAFFYFGNQVESFEKEFSKYGSILLLKHAARGKAR